MFTTKETKQNSFIDEVLTESSYNSNGKMHFNFFPYFALLVSKEVFKKYLGNLFALGKMVEDWFEIIESCCFHRLTVGWDLFVLADNNVLSLV